MSLAANTGCQAVERKTNQIDTNHSCISLIDEKGKTKMNEVQTKDPEEAVEILLGKALDEAPYISEDEVFNEHNSLRRAWGSRQLFSGNSTEIKAIILSNLQELAEIKQFDVFVIKVIDKLLCAQVMAVFSTDTFTGVRVWHTEGKIYACGNSVFHG
jgi:hypothetical protein